jgi:hypothetical protein
MRHGIAMAGFTLPSPTQPIVFLGICVLFVDIDRLPIHLDHDILNVFLRVIRPELERATDLNIVAVLIENVTDDDLADFVGHRYLQEV